MADKFIKNGYEIVEFDKKADIYIINTCTVTNMSDRKSRQIIGRVKNINPNSVLIVTGCYAQIAAEELKENEKIDLIIGNTEKKDIVNIVKDYINNKDAKNNKINLTDINKQKEYVDFGSITYTEKTRAVIKVQDGCNNFCSYCIIPYAKGRVRSRTINSVIDEIKSIVKTGIQEVVITGIHVASYGMDFENNNIGLIDLLEEINKIDNLKRIRLGSLEPNLITDEFIKRLKKLDKICDHFHLSLQSGCNETLERMNRKYSVKDFRNVVKRIRDVYPNVALTTDIIVGFPGETEEEFEKTYNFLKEINFYKMHVFKYSQRKGTRAAIMQNQVDGKTKEERSHILIELSNKNEIEYLKKYIGKKVKVLFEQKENEYYKGHTSNYIVVKTKGENLDNQIIDVDIKEESNAELYGDIV